MDDDIPMIIVITVVICILLGAVFGISIKEKSFEHGKFCPVCGAHYSETDLYCTNDGTELLIVGGN